MIGLYLTDTVKLIHVVRDNKGVITETEEAAQSARVKDTNKLVIDKNGNEVRGSMEILLKYPQTVDENGKVKVITKYGAPYTHPDKKFKILSKSDRGGFSSGFTVVVI
jgi:hypothetical protein